MHIKKLKNYFSHDFNARNDIKLKKVNMELGLTGLGLYWCIIECLYENGGYLDLNQIDLLAYELRTEKNLIEKIINDYDLFKINKNKFYSKSVLQRLEKINEISKKNKENIKKRWEKEKQKMEMKTNDDCNTVVLQSNYKEKEKENKNKIKENIIITTTTINNIYDFVEKNFGRTLSPIEYEKISNWKDNELTRYAIETAVVNNVKKINYVEAILRSYQENNINSVEEAKTKNQEFKDKNTKKELFDYDWLEESLNKGG